MDEQEYRRLYAKIADKIADKLQEEIERVYALLESERMSYTDSLRLTWALDNDDPPPDVSDISEPLTPVKKFLIPRGNGHYPPIPEHFATGNDRIRYVIPLIEGDIISQPLIADKLRELFPDEVSYIQTPNISKVLRSLEERGELVKVRNAHGNQPTIYRRVKR